RLAAPSKIGRTVSASAAPAGDFEITAPRGARTIESEINSPQRGKIHPSKSLIKKRFATSKTAQPRASGHGESVRIMAQAWHAKAKAREEIQAGRSSESAPSKSQQSQER